MRRCLSNPRFVVTSLKSIEIAAQHLYEAIYCARGEMENRIKECQLDLFADRTSAATMRANQLRLWFASIAYVLLCALRRIADATCGTIRLKLLKIGALVRISVRHQGSDVIRLSLAERIRPRSHTTTLCCRLTRTRHRTVIRSPNTVAARTAGHSRPGFAARRIFRHSSPTTAVFRQPRPDYRFAL